MQRDIGAEYEYFIFQETPESLREKGFQDLTPLTPGMFGYPWLRSSTNSGLAQAILHTCHSFGVTVI